MKRNFGFLLLILAGCATPPEVRDLPEITDVVFHWETHERLARGSDNWPLTWADDDHQYTAWGDGGGFGGTNRRGRVSLGFARVVGNQDDYSGRNVWGGVGRKRAANFGGKSYGIVSIDGVLYAWWGPGTGAIRLSDSQLERNESGGDAWSGRTVYESTRLLVSTNKGKSWTQSDWDLTKSDERLIMPTILNFGKDYDGARDNYVYHYFIRKEPTGSALTIHRGGPDQTGKIDLARVPKERMMDLSAYQFFAGLDRRGQPRWSRSPSQRQPVFEDANGVGWTVSVSYNQGLQRYFLVTEHSSTAEGRIGMFDAPEPWGPWKAVLYCDAPGFGDGDIAESSFYWNFSNKWLSDDGRDFVLVFTGLGENDSWNTVSGSFVLSDETIESDGTTDNVADCRPRAPGLYSTDGE